MTQEPMKRNEMNVFDWDTPEALADRAAVRAVAHVVIDEEPEALQLLAVKDGKMRHLGYGEAADHVKMFEYAEERVFGLPALEAKYRAEHPETPAPIDTPSVAQDDDDLQLAREELKREFGESAVMVQTRYLYADRPLHPVGFIAVGNQHDWAAYTAGLPTYSRPGPFWVRVYRDGAKLPEDVARAMFPGMMTHRYRP